MNLSDRTPGSDKDAFGLTEKDVADIIERTRAEIAAIQDAHADPGNQMFGGPEVQLAKATRQLGALTSQSQTELLVQLSTVHSRVFEIKKSGQAEAKQIRQIRTEFPDLLDLYPLLRKRPWGYSIGQKIMAAKMMDEENK